MRHRVPLITAGLVLGIGLGAFVDGILFHQILQWHHMLTGAGYPATSLANLEMNMLWDGLFHAFAWVTTVAGVVLLWRAGRRRDVDSSGRTLLGSVLGGWGAFDLVEGIVNHQILGLHHVRPGPHQLAWDLGYLGFGAALVVIGWMLVRAGRQGMAAGTEPEDVRRATESDRAA